jgi:hypothetical protein
MLVHKAFESHRRGRPVAARPGLLNEVVAELRDAAPVTVTVCGPLTGRSSNAGNPVNVGDDTVHGRSLAIRRTRHASRLPSQRTLSGIDGGLDAACGRRS